MIEPSIIQTTLLLLFIHVPLHSFAVTRQILQSLASPPPQANICSIHIKRHRANVLFFHEEKSCRISKTIPNNRNSKNRPYFHHSFNKHPKYIWSKHLRNQAMAPTYINFFHSFSLRAVGSPSLFAECDKRFFTLHLFSRSNKKRTFLKFLFELLKVLSFIQTFLHIFSTIINVNNFLFFLFLSFVTCIYPLFDDKVCKR